MDETTAAAEERAWATRAARDPAAFAPLYERYAARVYKFFRYRVDDIPTAEDLTAQTFAKALTDIARYSPQRAPFAAWLFGIANHTASGHYRAAQRQPLTLLPDVPDANSDAPPEQAVITAETSAQLAAAVATLNDRERELIALKFAAGLANTDIAAITGLTESNTGVILHRAMQKLRRVLSAEEDIP